MKYDAKYPEAQHLAKVELCLMYHRDPGPCWHCGDETNFIDINFQAHLCSDECQEAKTQEYVEASMQ